MSGILQGLIGSLKSAASSTTDAFFNLVTLLLNTTATDGAQNKTFQDSSTNNFIITTNGNTTQGTFTPFSQTGWSNFFNGTTDYLSPGTTATNFICTGTTSGLAATFEAWVFPTSWNGLSGYQNNTIWAKGGTYATFGLYNGTLQFFVNGGGTVSSSSSVSLNTWSYVAVTVNGATVTFYINGVSAGSGTLTGGISAAASGTSDYIAYQAGGGSNSWFAGYLSNFRISNVVRTISTTPTTAFTSDANTVVLSCQSNRFKDNGTNTFTITPSGTPSVQAFSPFLPTTSYDAAVVGGSGYFDGTGDYLTFTDASNTLDMGGAVTSLEGFFYPTSTTSAQCLVAKGGGAGSWSTSNGFEWQLTYSSGKFDFTFNNAGSPANVASATVPINQWYYVAVATDASSNISLYLNGTRVATSTNAITKPTSRTLMYLGQDVSGSYFTGYMSGVRFIGGSGAYNPTSTTITVPTAPPTAITNTKLLTNFTNAGIFDSAAKNVLETVGGAQVSTTQAKWGTTSISFNGTNSVLQAPASSVYDFGSGDFTIELWTKGSNSASTAGALLIGLLTTGGATNTNWALFKDAPTQGYIVFYASDGTTYQVNGIGGAATLNDGSWHHVAVTRSGSSFKVFVDGTQVGSTGTWSGSISSTARPLKLGFNGTAEYLNGYLDDVRITKGYARYTANFTPPTAAFPLL